MKKHLIALKALLDVVGEELYLSEEDDPSLRQDIGVLAMRIKDRLTPKRDEE